jgi:hypothetical protein
MLNNDIEFDHVSAHTLEQLRLIRNECRLFMTNNQKKISVTQQEKWFNELTEDVMPFLVINSDKFIGYAVIKIDGNETLLTGGLIESFRGQGYGRIIFQKKRPIKRLVFFFMIKIQLFFYKMIKVLVLTICNP